MQLRNHLHLIQREISANVAKSVTIYYGQIQCGISGSKNEEEIIILNAYA